MTASGRSPDSSDRLTSAQLRMITALLEGGDQAAAAAAARRSPRTVRRWLKDPRIQSALATASREVFDAAVQRLQQGAGAAADALVGMAAGEMAPSASRVAAARAVLEIARDAGELDELRDTIELLVAKLKHNTTTRYS